MLEQSLNINGIELTAGQKTKLLKYLELMRTWNQVYNLTTITNPREMIYLHIIDSLVVLPYLEGNFFLDVGTGAGLPGIPLAIANPTQHWFLLDKTAKKTRFLTQVSAELGLKNVEIINARCEDFEYSSGFDGILSRAFGSLALFVATTEHLLAPNGKLIAMKGKYPQTELDEIPPDFCVEKSERVDIKGMNIERHVIVLKRLKRE